MSSSNPMVNSFTASVPIAVYRELATELKLTQAQLAFYRSRFEQTQQQNLELLASIASHSDGLKPTIASQTIDPAPKEMELKAHWLALIILIIVVCSFGLGFVITNTIAVNRVKTA